MLMPMRGTLIALASMLLWGSVNRAHRPPIDLPPWAFGLAMLLLFLAAGHQLFGIRHHHTGHLLLGRLFVSTLLALLLALAVSLAGFGLERALAPASVAWSDSVLRAAWHGLATLTVGVAVTPGTPPNRHGPNA